MNAKRPITIIGAGAWGMALASVLVRNGESVNLIGRGDYSDLEASLINSFHAFDVSIDRIPETVSLFTDISNFFEQLSDSNTDLMIVVPSSAFLSVIEELKPFEAKINGIAWATKGMDENSGQLLHETLKGCLKLPHPLAVLSGPSFADEVLMNAVTAVTLASEEREFAAYLRKVFENKNFRVYENSDLIGAQLCGVLKNIYAIAAGIGIGLGVAANARAALLTRSLSEMSMICSELGGKVETVQGLAGLGDLSLSCTDLQSRNLRFGIALGSGDTPQQAHLKLGSLVEGYRNCKTIYRRLENLRERLPIMEKVYQILYKGLSPKNAVSTLLETPSVPES